MSRLTVVAVVTAKPNSIEEVKAELNALVEPTLKEDGCINYDLHQSIEDPALFVFHENWTSEAHLDTHLQTDHIIKCQVALESLVEDAQVHKVRQV
jgi:quinol monooxygenase YgiN